MPDTDPEIVEYAHCLLPTKHGEVDFRVFRPVGDDSDKADESIAISKGVDFSSDENVFVRVHSECFTGEVLGSLKCDCLPQLELALARIAELERGVIVYLRQEGRGIGLGNKIRAYAEQARGADTIEANHILGFPTDLRDFRTAAAILKHLGVGRIDINTNNPRKVEAMTESGIQINEVIPSLTDPTEHNALYLKTKAEELGHTGLGPILSQLSCPFSDNPSS